MTQTQHLELLVKILNHPTFKRGLAYLDICTSYEDAYPCNRSSEESSLFVYGGSKPLDIFVRSHGPADGSRKRVLIAGESFPGVYEFDSYSGLKSAIRSQNEEVKRANHQYANVLPEFWIIDQEKDPKDCPPLGFILLGKTKEDEWNLETLPEFSEGSKWLEYEWDALQGNLRSRPVPEGHLPYSVLLDDLGDAVNPARTVAFVQRTNSEEVRLAQVHYNLITQAWGKLLLLQNLNLSFLEGVTI